MITSMRECVAYNDLWPWPISSRSFGLGLENRFRSVASTVLDGFFPYLIQMITSMRRCVACDDLWPWPISSRSFDRDFENRVRSVASTVLDGFFPYWVQMITSMRRCAACDDFENRVRSVTFSVLDRLFPYLPQIITTIRGSGSPPSGRNQGNQGKCEKKFPDMEKSWNSISWEKSWKSHGNANSRKENLFRFALQCLYYHIGPDLIKISLDPNMHCSLAEICAMTLYWL